MVEWVARIMARLKLPTPMHPVDIMQNMPLLFKMTCKQGEIIDYNTAVARFKDRYMSPANKGLFN